MTKELRQRKLPKTRNSTTHEFAISGVKVFVTVGMYENGRPGELFISVAKEGSTLGGLFNVISIITSMALQYGVPLDKLCAKLSYMSFPPQGFTGGELGYASSIVDYIFRWLGKKYGTKEVQEEKGIDDNLIPDVEELIKEIPLDNNPQIVVESPLTMKDVYSDFQSCTNCGGLMQRSGSCYCCVICGTSSGCS